MKWFSGQSTFLKMLSFILLICVCFYIIGFGSNEYSRRELARQVIGNIDGRVSVWKKNLEQQIDSLLIAQSNLVNDQSVMQINVFWEQMDSYDRVERFSKLSERLREIKIMHGISEKINIHFQEHKMVISNIYPLVDTYEEDQLYNYQQVEINEEGKLLLTTFFPLRIQDSAKRKSAYYVRTYIPAAKFADQLHLGVYEGEGVLLALDREGELFASSTGTAEELGEEWNILNAVKERIISQNTIEDFRLQKGEIAVGTYSEKANLWIVYLYPKELVQGPLRFFGVLNLSLALFAIVLFLAYVGYARKTFAKPLNTIMTAMEQDKDTFLIEERDQDEFALIYSRYNEMILRTNKLMREKMEAQYQSRMAELRQLQYQIQPHFLYNSIFTIYRMAQLEENEEISEYTKHLGQYYQYITKSSDRSVRISQEMEYLRNYLYIQKTRFGDRVDIQMELISDEVKNLEIAPMLLQPLAENAYEHGLKERLKGGILKIVSKYEEGKFYFIVEDNGRGATEEELAIIRRDLNQENFSSNVIHGLTNINMRVKLLYGEDSGVLVESAEEGFRVTLRLSLLTKENV